MVYPFKILSMCIFTGKMNEFKYYKIQDSTCNKHLPLQKDEDLSLQKVHPYIVPSCGYYISLEVLWKDWHQSIYSLCMYVNKMLFHYTIIPINSSKVPLEENKKVLLKSEDIANLKSDILGIFWWQPHVLQSRYILTECPNFR